MIRRILVLGLSALLLTGCGPLPAEEHAFAVVLAVDVQDSLWRMSVRMPSYVASGKYMTCTGEGETIQQAAAALAADAPMPLDLGQLRLTVVTERLAASPMMPEALAWLEAREDLRLQAVLCVTQGDMDALMEASNPTTGSRLSKSLQVALESGAGQGIIPLCTLSEALRLGKRQTPLFPLVEATPDGKSLRFSGGWAQGMVFSEEDCRCLMLLTGAWKKGTFPLGEGEITLLDASVRPQISQNTAVLKGNVTAATRGVSPEEAQEMLIEKITRLMMDTSASGLDVLGLKRQAIREALTAAKWQEDKWQERLRSLNWQVELDFLWQD